MLFWHLGLTSMLIFLTLGVRRIDYRVVLLGSILPDLIDKPVGRIFFEEEFQASRLFGHTLLFVTVLLLCIQLFLRGRAARRWFILPIAALVHLALDAMWNHPVTLFWPFFSTTFPPDPVDHYWLEVLRNLVTNPWEVARELAGLGALVYLFMAFELRDRGRLREFLKEGKLHSGAGRTAAPPEQSGGG